MNYKQYITEEFEYDPSQEFIGFDLDNTLAKYSDGDCETGYVGEPILPMVNKLKEFLANGEKVKIFTARAFFDDEKQLNKIRIWCMKVFGTVLDITASKSPYMKLFFDDRAVQVDENGKEVTDNEENK